MLSTILTWAGASIGVLILITMACGGAIADIDDSLRDRASR